MTHHRFAARLQTQYQTSRFEGVRREVTERYRFGIAMSKLKQHPIGRGRDLGTSLFVSDQIRENLHGLSRPPLQGPVIGGPARGSGQAIRVLMTSTSPSDWIAVQEQPESGNWLIGNRTRIRRLAGLRLDEET